VETKRALGKNPEEDRHKDTQNRGVGKGGKGARTKERGHDGLYTNKGYQYSGAQVGKTAKGKQQKMGGQAEGITVFMEALNGAEKRGIRGKKIKNSGNQKKEVLGP